jgi:dihydrofolate reductase
MRLAISSLVATVTLGAKQMGQPFDLLLGRKTYEIFAS